MRPSEEDPGAFEPYFVAICSECDWLGDTVAVSPDHPDPEAELRRQASRHSDRVEAEVRRPLG